MNRAVLLTKPGALFNESVLLGLLARGCSVAMVVPGQAEADEYAGRLPERSRERFFPICGVPDDEAGIREAVDQAALRMGGLHDLIHGVEVADEAQAYASDPGAFGFGTTAALRSRFLYSRAAAAHMARNKAGHMLFLLLSDSLYYAGYPSSPVMNHGTIAMMKTLAKELSPFRVAVNALTYGYYALPEDPAGLQTLKRRLEIHTLKPYLPLPQEMAEASVEWLLRAPAHLISGQNIQIGAGMDPAL
ncbi:SDR family oxidoreductase [Cohnella nanjingensis]|uniref:SDR family oxidoreductase n=1 Tax=Cohnella nanjingensis TaxID=1387779 RepID=A0A7X0RU62_9BACL|nr:SDR family oxidoreductase [Cohnella nanjingensis]MBB6673757.1 SDR family oxidoreductase [Cohnella nanjingensis]